MQCGNIERRAQIQALLSLLTVRVIGFTWKHQHEHGFRQARHHSLLEDIRNYDNLTAFYVPSGIIHRIRGGLNPTFEYIENSKTLIWPHGDLLETEDLLQLKTSL